MIFLYYFNDLPDYRQPGKVEYLLPEAFLLVVLAVLAGTESFSDIARFGEKKLELLRRFRPFKNGTPAHDHLGDILARRIATSYDKTAESLLAALKLVALRIWLRYNKFTSYQPASTNRLIGRRISRKPNHCLKCSAISHNPFGSGRQV